MVNKLVGMLLLFLIVSFGSEALAEINQYPLQFGYDLHSMTKNDSVSIVFSVHGMNISDVPVKICGAFYFSCAFKPDSNAGFTLERCPTFLLLDKKTGKLFECETMTIDTSESVSDTLSFTFSKKYFSDCSGSIEIEAELLLGKSGDSIGDAERIGGEALKVLIPIN